MSGSNAKKAVKNKKYGDLADLIVFGEHTIAINNRRLRSQFEHNILIHGTKKLKSENWLLKLIRKFFS